jgi:hypothetical protein
MLSGRKKKDYAAESSADAIEAAASGDARAAADGEAEASAEDPIPETLTA